MPSHRGQWQRITDDGPVTIPCPMKVTWDAALQVREAVKRHLGRKVFVVAVLIFPDMEPDPDIELRAENDRVKVLFGTDNLVERLVESRRRRRDLQPAHRLARRRDRRDV